MAWIQVEALKEDLRAYQARTRKSQAEVAGDLGTTYGTLRFWLSGTRPPKRENLQAICTLFQQPLSRYQDDPGAPPEGATPGSSEFDRFMLRTMGTDLGKMTEAQKQAAFNAWKAFSDGILGR